MKDDSDVSSLSQWSLVDDFAVPTPKKRPKQLGLPVPLCLSNPVQPRFSAPFQVSDADRSQPRYPVSGPSSVSAPAPGLERPMLRRDSSASHAGSLDFRLHDSSGLDRPPMHVQTPSSITGVALDTCVPTDTGWDRPVSSTVRAHADNRPKQFSSNPGAALTRVKLSSTSPVVMQIWKQCVRILLPVSQTLQQMELSQLCHEHHNRFLNQFAATTLVKYLQALLRFINLCDELQVPLDTLSEISMADILITGSMARRSDGSGPRRSITIKALRWACKQLDIQCFQHAFSSLVSSFEKQKIPYDRKEALPLPLFTIVQWERRVLSSASSIQEVVIIGGLLLLAWSGLRFSDLQRSYLDSWRIDDISLRGLCWRSKTCDQSTPFGIKLSGFLSVGPFTWVHRYIMVLDKLYTLEKSASIDFAIPSFGGSQDPVYPFIAMPYGEALFFLRHYLTLPWRNKTSAQLPSGMSYSIHGLKATLLSWAAQAQVDESDRRMHGKHKAQSQSVQLYSRDDILGSLRLQTTLIQKTQGGWRPQTPLARGGQVPLTEVAFTLERFSKQIPDHTWWFFQFDKQFDQKHMLDSQPESMEGSVPVPSSSASSDSYSDSDESESETDGAHIQKATPKPQSTRDMGVAEEGYFGLHRSAWHVMILAPDGMPSLPAMDGHVFKTACGRQLSGMKVSMSDAINISLGQCICNHGGCRKAFQSMEA